MPPDDRERLQHMLDAAQEAITYSRARQLRDLDTDRIAAYGLVRPVEIIGEAAARVSAKRKAELPSLP